MMKLIAVVMAIATLSACTTVKPWERGYLAKDTMQGAPIAQKSALDRHVYFAKEGSSGGGQAAGGGCGCN